MLSVLVSFVAAVFYVLIPAVTAQTSSKYRLVQQKMTYEAARLHCRSEYGTDLASIHNTADNGEAKNLCATGEESCWFGLTDLAQENEFVWEDGTAFDYGTDVSGVYPWQSNRPDDGQRNAPFDSEDCCELRVGFEYNWNDWLCSAAKYFICNLDTAPATTQQPTNGPTKGPTNNPFDAATTAATESAIEISTTVEYSTTQAYTLVSTADEATGSNMAWTWVSIALCALFFCACSAYGFYYYRKKKVDRDRQPPVPSAVLQPPLQPPAHVRLQIGESESRDRDASLMYDPDLAIENEQHTTGQEQTEQVSLDASQCAAWTSDEVVRWIVDLNYEAHKQYETRLRAAFAADIINGKAMSGVSDGYLRQCGVGDVHCRVILQNIYQVIRRHCAELSLELEEQEQAEDEEEGEGEVMQRHTRT